MVELDNMKSEIQTYQIPLQEVSASLDLENKEIWWKVIEMEDGVLWMNNCNGEMAFIEKNGRILKTII